MFVSGVICSSPHAISTEWLRRYRAFFHYHLLHWQPFFFYKLRASQVQCFGYFSLNQKEMLVVRLQI